MNEVLRLEAINKVNCETIECMAEELRQHKEVIEEQKRTIAALNSCIGGATTLENIRRIDELEAQIAEFTANPPPPEAYTDAEKLAYAYGWWKALEVQRKDRNSIPTPEVEGVPI